MLLIGAIYIMRNILRQKLFSEDSEVGDMWADKEPELPSKEELFYKQNEEDGGLYGRSYVLLKLVVLLVVVYVLLRRVNSR